MKYGLQPTTEKSGVCPLLEIKRGFAALEYSRCCLSLDTTQGHKYVSDTARESHRRSLFLFDLAAGHGSGYQAGRGWKKKKKGQMLPFKQVQEPVCTTMAHVTPSSNQKTQGKRKGNKKKKGGKGKRTSNSATLSPPAWHFRDTIIFQCLGRALSRSTHQKERASLHPKDF